MGGFVKTPPFLFFHIPFVILLNKTERLQTSVCSRSVFNNKHDKHLNVCVWAFYALDSSM